MDPIVARAALFVASFGLVVAGAAGLGGWPAALFAAGSYVFASLLRK